MDERSPGRGPELYGYFDYAASEPPFPEALETYLDTAVLFFGNPSSAHLRGMKARERFESARERFKELLSVDRESEVVVTSGGTEANNLVINSVLTDRPGRILVAHDVHPSSWYAKRRYQNRADVLKVNEQGQIAVSDLASRLTSNHCLASIVHGNNETGVIQDLEGIISLCAERGVLLHVDGVQAVGRLPLRLGGLPGVFYTFSCHKFGAPRGSGGVITGSPEMLRAQLCGGPQERGLRAGTENIASFVAAVTALEQNLQMREECSRRLRDFAAYVEKRVTERFPDAVPNSSAAGLPGFVSVSIPGLNGTMAVTEMAMKGFDISSGSACHAGSTEPSRIIRAMGRDRVTALGTLRITMGYGTHEREVQEMTEALLNVIERGLEVS